MEKLKSRTGKVHIKSEDFDGTLCNWYLGLYSNPGMSVTSESVTCKHCLKILLNNNPNREEILAAAESFMPISRIFNKSN